MQDEIFVKHDLRTFFNIAISVRNPASVWDVATLQPPVIVGETGLLIL
jgi:hypothetical protein